MDVSPIRFNVSHEKFTLNVFIPISINFVVGMILKFVKNVKVVGEIYNLVV